MSRLDRARIETLIPHGPEMCLLDRVEHWDGDGLVAWSDRAGRTRNPLRRADGRLGAASLIELAAQAMALHGRLTAGGAGGPVPGLLVSLRDVRVTVPLVEDGMLRLRVTRIMGDGGGATYEFSVADAEWGGIVEGRAMVMFGVAP